MVREPEAGAVRRRHRLRLTDATRLPPVRTPNPGGSTSRVVVVGAGLVGLATARALLLARPACGVTVLEKEAEPGRHQSTHNSGVLHAGLYYRPGSAKARFAVDGIRRMTAFCREHGIAHEICGKLVVATNPSELPRLRTLLERGTQNGLRGLRWLEGEAAREIEPEVRAVAAVHVPEEGIVNYAGVVRALEGEVKRLGGVIVARAGLRAARRSAGEWLLDTAAGEYVADYLVNCAGLHADRVAALAGARPGCRIVPFRGEYFELRPERRGLVRHLIYPVPNPAFPFLGVHLTRQISGGIEAGPNAVLALSREGYAKHSVRLRDVLDASFYPGLWRFLARYPRTAVMELCRSFSRTLFAHSLQRLVPAIHTEDLVRGGAGVRAQAMTPDGRLVEDFYFQEEAQALHVLNAPSPAATASLALGAEIARRIVLG
jgi:(S)-2-hydroxyglutarate dehydrogenase